MELQTLEVEIPSTDALKQTESDNAYLARMDIIKEARCKYLTEAIDDPRFTVPHAQNSISMPAPMSEEFLRLKQNITKWWMFHLKCSGGFVCHVCGPAEHILGNPDVSITVKYGGIDFEDANGEPNYVVLYRTVTNKCEGNICLQCTTCAQKGTRTKSAIGHTVVKK